MKEREAHQVRVIVLRAAGTNCDLESKYAFEREGARAELVHVNRLLATPSLLDQYDVLFIPGGFTYGDDISAGRILANQLRFKLGKQVRKFIENGGLVLGVCNGFQVLVKAGLLPDPFGPQRQTVTLAGNDSGRFECRWVYLKISSKKAEFIHEGDIIELPVAHREGKFVACAPELLDKLRENGQIVLQYVNERGQPAGYPWNPNGSQLDIAGICDPTGRVLGLMPHPERFVEPYHHPNWTRFKEMRTPDGRAFFRNAVRYCENNRKLANVGGAQPGPP